MNNTKRTTLAIVAILTAATLVVGTLATTTTLTQTAFAYSQKNKKDNGKDGNDNGNTITIQKCKQAAIQSGFDNNQGQECENVICTHPGENATCVQEGVVTPTTTTTTTPPPVKLNCEQCIRKFLNDAQISELISFAGQDTLGEVCDILHTGTQNDIQALFENISGSHDIAVQIIQCLLDAGIVFGTRT
jgi:hypothetical protein